MITETVIVGYKSETVLGIHIGAYQPQPITPFHKLER